MIPPLAALPGGPTDHTHVLCRRGGSEAVFPHLSHWQCGGLAAGSREIYEGQRAGQY